MGPVISEKSVGEGLMMRNRLPPTSMNNSLRISNCSIKSSFLVRASQIGKGKADMSRAGESNIEDVDEKSTKVDMPRTIFNEIITEVGAKKQLVD